MTMNTLRSDGFEGRRFTRYQPGTRQTSSTVLFFGSSVSCYTVILQDRTVNLIVNWNWSMSVFCATCPPTVTDGHCISNRCPLLTPSCPYGKDSYLVNCVLPEPVTLPQLSWVRSLSFSSDVCCMCIFVVVNPLILVSFPDGVLVSAS